jgi:branched-chain amino acid transport system ATP-binding protein
VTEILRLRSVRAGYRSTVVLENIDFAVAERGSLAVLGRNGVGKTTLLASIMGHTTLYSGEIEYRGRSLRRLPVYERARLGIGYVPQAREIFPSLTVEENLRVAELKGGWPPQRVYELFPRLAERRRHMGNQISGGEQQMLAIGRALAGGPSLLLLDEPLEGLAPLIVDLLLKAIERLLYEESLAVVFVEQSARLALAVTENALVLSRGRIVHYGRSADLLADQAALANLILSG